MFANNCLNQQFPIGLVEVHSTLSRYSRIPILGMLPVAVKTLAGIVEVAVSAIFILCLAGPSFISKKSEKLLNISISHITVGITRTVSGIVLAIPFVGLALVPPDFGNGRLMALNAPVVFFH